MKEVAIGIDIGGTNTKVGLVDEQGEILAENSIKTLANLNKYLENLTAEIHRLTKETPGEFKVHGVGIGAPNANYNKGTIENAPNLKWGDMVYFVDLFEQHHHYPIYFTNDANAATVGEMVYGDAKGMKDFMVLTLGTGLGSGIVANGQLIIGHNGFAGEFGHTLVNVNGRSCGCGRKGCLETYVSATGIKRTVYKILADSRDHSELRSISFDDLSSRMITEAALRGDKVALEAFSYTGRVLGHKLADAVVHTDPEAIFLFGGLVKAGECLMGPTLENFEKNVMKTYKGKVKILPSGLLDKNAAVLGSAALVWHKV